MTIATYLTKHQNELWACNNDVASMKKKTLELLNADELKDNPDINSAKIIIENCKNDSAFLSNLTTLMTGIKVTDTKSMRQNREEFNKSNEN